MAALTIDFRRDGNAKSFLGDGWSSQEPNHIWAVGSVSTLVIRGVSSQCAYRLTLDLMAYIPPGVSAPRRLDVAVCDSPVATFMLGRERARFSCEINKDLIPTDREITIRLNHPDPIRPCDHGGLDTRPLAVALHAAILAPMSETSDRQPEDSLNSNLPSPQAPQEAASIPTAADRLNVAGGTPERALKVAALTFVFNEAVNLPIWIRHYGENFGRKNLFVVDRESTDGSTSDLGDINRIVIPRDAFDDRKKADFMSSMQNALLNYYDVVICSDCDELLVPDPRHYAGLSDYVTKREFDYVTSIGLNIRHVIHQEPPLDMKLPILAQRRYATFHSATCKTLISRVPIRWLAGLHCLDRRPKFDRRLFMFHTKAMDFNIAAARYRINYETVWTSESLAHGHGAHHRYQYERVVRELFLDAVHVFDARKFSPFEFSDEMARFESEIVERDGFYWIPMNIVRHVEIPDSLRSAL